MAITITDQEAKRVFEWLESLDDETLLNVWNCYASEADVMEKYIYINGEYFFKEMFYNSPDKAVEAWYFGSDKNNWYDDYIMFNDDGYLETISKDDLRGVIEYMIDDYVADYIWKNAEKFTEYGFTKESEDE